MRELHSLCQVLMLLAIRLELTVFLLCMAFDWLSGYGN